MTGFVPLHERREFLSDKLFNFVLRTSCFSCLLCAGLDVVSKEGRPLLRRLIFDSLKSIGRYKEVEMSRAVCYVAEDHVCLEHFVSYPEIFK